MEKMVERYLDELKKLLRSLPKEEQEDAVNEIRSHIVESQANGKPVASILSDLGDVKALSKAYLSNYHLEKIAKKKGFSSFLKSCAFFASTGLISIFVVSLFGFIGSITGIFTLLMPIFGVMRTFGAEHIFVLWEDTQVPSLLGIPTGILLGLLFAIITWSIIKLLKGYFRMIAKGYRTILPSE